MNLRPRFFALLLVGFLSGCGTPPTADNIVTLVLDIAPTSLDPRIGVDASSERLDQLIFSALVRVDDTSSFIPDLAESWEISDATTYVFHLRDDVRFHDGRALRARDVVYTCRSIMEESFLSPLRGALELVEEIEALDDYTVRFSLSEPFAPFLWNLVGIRIIPDGAGTDLATHPIGSGPFVFEHYIRDGEVLLRSNPDYFGEKPHIDAVRFKIVPEAVVRGLELRKGTVDIALNVLPPDMVETLSLESSLRVMSTEGTNYQYLAFNLKDPLFGDVRVRRAIAHAIDRNALIEHLWRGQVRPAYSVLPPNNWAYFGAVRRYEYDPARARAILEEAGHTNLSFTYRTSTDETGLLVASVLQEQFKQVGIGMEIQSNEFATFFSDVLNGNFQMYSLRWIGGNNDPDIFNSVFHSEMVPSNGGRNRGYYSNPQVDRWIELARRGVDTEKRKEYYALIQKQVSEDLPYVGLWYLNNVSVYNNRIKGIKLSPAGDYDFLTQISISSPESSFP